MQCPCGSNRNFDQCCGPFLAGAKHPPTAEALTRARYTAYTQGHIDFIGRTFAPESLKTFDPAAARRWAAEANWLGLDIMATERGSADDRTGTVTFVARYRQGRETIAHHEVSQFRKTDAGEWRFVSGDTEARQNGRPGQTAPKAPPVVRETPKAGRNDPCPCGSGKKFKKCCGAQG